MYGGTEYDHKHRIPVPDTAWYGSIQGQAHSLAVRRCRPSVPTARRKGSVLVFGMLIICPLNVSVIYRHEADDQAAEREAPGTSLRRRLGRVSRQEDCEERSRTAQRESHRCVCGVHDRFTRLTGCVLGGKKGDRWRDDVWTIKYLPKFKWSMLSEQVGA
jgi:hypothetical protein